MVRRLPDFVDAFCRYAEVYNSTPNYAKASALWMIGTAAKRAIGMRARGNELFPNLFLGLIGNPGAGKSQAVEAARSIFFAATGMNPLPASVTRAAMEDYMQSNLQQRQDPSGALLLSHECIALTEELQGILPGGQEMDHLTLYNILYDNRKMHVAQTRTHGKIQLEAPYCSILTGAQPAFLQATMPEVAWGMGFMSRMMMIWDTPGKRRSMFLLRDVDQKLKADLIHDLEQIANGHGWMEWDDKAQLLYDEWWVEQGGLPVPQAKRLAMGYNSRRELHMAKLAMIMSLSRGMDLVVTIEDVGRAIETLLLFESNMRHIFSEMAATGSMVALADVIDKIRADTAEGRQTDEATIIELLMQRFPSTQVHSLVELMITSNAIVLSGGTNARGLRKFQASPKLPKI